jgi:hypothetical protein
VNCGAERLIHYSASPVTCVQSRSQPFTEFQHQKPKGLWVSVEGKADWKDWCQMENFGLDRLAVGNVVTLAATANILRLRSACDLDDFTRTYGVPFHWQHSGSHLGSGIQWPVVAMAHQGIIIAPYIWSRRMDFGWYYGWDCASGCIWDAGAIETIGVLSAEKRHREQD